MGSKLSFSYNRSSSLRKTRNVMFLVPDSLFPLLKKLLRKKTFRTLLSDFVRCHSHTLLNPRLDANSTFAKIYQNPLLGLNRVGAKVEEKDWLELQSIASALGISACKLFSQLLVLAGRGKGRVRALTTPLTYTQTLFSSKLKIFLSYSPSYKKGLRRNSS